MVDLDRLPMLSLVLLLLAAAMSVGGYVLGHASVPSADEAATARNQAGSLGYRQAVADAQPTARRHGLDRGQAAGRSQAGDVIAEYRADQRARQLRLDNKRKLAALIRRARRNPHISHLELTRTDVGGAKGHPSDKTTADKGDTHK